jgi:hypothetical protein
MTHPINSAPPSRPRRWWLPPLLALGITGMLAAALLNPARNATIGGARYLVLLRRHVRGSLALLQDRRQSLRQPEVRAFIERLIRAERTELQVIDRLILPRLQWREPAQSETGGLTHE